MNRIAKGYTLLYPTKKTVLPADNELVSIFYVIQGDCTIDYNGIHKTLRAKDLFLAGPDVYCSMIPSHGCTTALLSIEYYYLCHAAGSQKLQFPSEGTENNPPGSMRLRDLLRQLIIADLDTNSGTEFLRSGTCALIADCLIRHFSVLPGTSAPDKEQPNLTCQKIIDYIHMNYQEELSLSSIAEKLFLSPSAASRLFRKHQKESFPAYVRKVRLSHARRLLESSDLSISEAALESGFSTPSMMNQAFRELLGETPSDYRSTHQTATSGIDLSVRKQALHVLRTNMESRQEKTEQVTADVRILKPCGPWKSKVLNVGFCYLLQNAALQRQLQLLKEKLDVEYVRVWNLFSEELMIRRSRHGSYNYALLDEVLDFCVDHDLKLFFDLAQRREMNKSSSFTDVFVNEETTSFESAAAWLFAMDSFLRHIVHRYGMSRVSTWIFELSFFLNDHPYYETDRYSAGLVWEQGYHLIRSNIPKARIAGPGLIGSRHELTQQVIDDFLGRHPHPDIFTAIHFPYTQNDLSALFNNSFQRITDQDFLKAQISFVKESLSAHHFQGEYWVTDWGESIANRSFLQDSCHRAAFMIRNVLQCHDLVDEFGLFYASDLLSIFSDSGAILSGSAGFVSRHGIMKPVCYAFEFLASLGRYIAARTEHCIVTLENDMDLRILCCSCPLPGPEFYSMPEDSFAPEEVPNIFIHNENTALEIGIAFIRPSETYTVRQRIVNSSSGSILDKWLDFGCSEDLMREDIEYLRQTCVPEIISEKRKTKDGILTLKLELQPHEFRLIKINRA